MPIDDGINPQTDPGSESDKSSRVQKRNMCARNDAFQLFLNRRQLEVEKIQTEQLLHEVTTMREQRVQWLEKLARFLQHELKNQMTAMGTSVNMAQGLADANDPSLSGLHRLNEGAPKYLMRAQKSLAQMRRLVESATEATSLEAASSKDNSYAINCAIKMTQPYGEPSAMTAAMSERPKKAVTNSDATVVMIAFDTLIL